MIEVETDVGSMWTGSPADWSTLADTAVRTAVAMSPFRSLIEKEVAIEVSVKLTEDDEVQALNASYRNKDAPTNVLSFPMVQRDLLDGINPGDGDAETLLGDIVLARGVCEREAADKGVDMATHATHLIVHGTYHLLGYDHMADAEAENMEQMERDALAALGIADPYAVEEA